MCYPSWCYRVEFPILSKTFRAMSDIQVRCRLLRTLGRRSRKVTPARVLQQSSRPGNLGDGRRQWVGCCKESQICFLPLEQLVFPLGHPILAPCLPVFFPTSSTRFSWACYVAAPIWACIFVRPTSVVESKLVFREAPLRFLVVPVTNLLCGTPGFNVQAYKIAVTFSSLA